jgi:uncharacterized protein YeaO (DUF488 family)
MSVKLKRAYESPARNDGHRYLVERLWPRGVSKDALKLTAWLKELAPSTELRRWYGHEPTRWREFAHRYEAELEAPEKQESLARLAGEAGGSDVTLVFATKDAEHSGARVLKDLLDRQLAHQR